MLRSCVYIFFNTAAVLLFLNTWVVDVSSYIYVTYRQFVFLLPTSIPKGVQILLITLNNSCHLKRSNLALNSFCNQTRRALLHSFLSSTSRQQPLSVTTQHLRSHGARLLAPMFGYALLPDDLTLQIAKPLDKGESRRKLLGSLCGGPRRLLDAVNWVRWTSP